MITDKELIQRVINRLNEREEIKKLNSGFEHYTSTQGNSCILLDGQQISVCNDEEKTLDCLAAIEETLNVIQ